jgi:hypothetical protein
VKLGRGVSLFLAHASFVSLMSRTGAGSRKMDCIWYFAWNADYRLVKNHRTRKHGFVRMQHPRVKIVNSREPGRIYLPRADRHI